MSSDPPVVLLSRYVLTATRCTCGEMVAYRDDICPKCGTKMNHEGQG